jgi:uncharacterized protein (DUF1778 family)
MTIRPGERASSYGLDQRWSNAHLRVSDKERALLEAASEQARTSLSDFVRRKALEAAEVDVLERRIVAIPAKDWEAFEAWADRPPQKIAALEGRARTDPKWRT